MMNYINYIGKKLLRSLTIYDLNLENLSKKLILN